MQGPDDETEEPIDFYLEPEEEVDAPKKPRRAFSESRPSSATTNLRTPGELVERARLNASYQKRLEMGPKEEHDKRVEAGRKGGFAAAASKRASGFKPPKESRMKWHAKKPRS